MDLELPTKDAIAEKELMVLLNSDLITIRNFPEDKKQYREHTEEFCAEDASRAESFVPFCWKKSKPSRKLKKLPKSNDSSSIFKPYSFSIQTIKSKIF
jgi:hypothetical protein